MVDFLNTDMTQADTIITTGEIAWFYCVKIFTFLCALAAIIGVGYYVLKLAMKE